MEVGEAENAVWPTTIEEFFHLGEHDTVNYVLLRRKFLVLSRNVFADSDNYTYVNLC